MPDVIVIGAGFAGLSAATALADAGAEVLVLEARPGLGGRASSFRDPETGELVDNGQHVLLGCYHETMRFLGRIGAGDAVHRQDGLRVPMIDRTGAASTLALPPLPSPLHLAGGVLAWTGLRMHDRASLMGIAAVLRRAHRGDLPQRGPETVRRWLMRHGQSARLCELLWEPFALAALNQSIDQAEASAFVTVLARTFGPDADDAALILPARPLSDLYAEPSRRWLEARGSRVRTQAPARVIVDGDGVRGVRVRDDELRAPVVISTVPWFALPDLFEVPLPALEPALAAAAATPALPIVTVNLWLDRPVLDGPLVGLPARTFQWVFDRRTIVGDGASHLSLVSSGAEAIVEMSNEALVARALDEVRSAIPAARAARVRKASAVRERRATFSLAPGMPERPRLETGIRGLLLAGDWIDTGLPATIESAVVSGHAAARAAIGMGAAGGVHRRA